jgi:hypothetical protein
MGMGSWSCVLVLRSENGGFGVVPVVGLDQGWQDLGVADIDGGGRLEVWTTWQRGSGGS